MATDLKTRLARAANAPVFILTQAKAVYEGRGGDIELDRSCPKDSDTIIDSMDYAFGIWKRWQVLDGAEDNLIFMKKLKDRGMDLEQFNSDAYAYLDLNKPCMDLRDVVYVPNPPPFNKMDKNHKGDD